MRPFYIIIKLGKILHSCHSPSLSYFLATYIVLILSISIWKSEADVWLCCMPIVQAHCPLPFLPFQVGKLGQRMGQIDWKVISFNLSCPPKIRQNISVLWVLANLQLLNDIGGGQEVLRVIYPAVAKTELIQKTWRIECSSTFLKRLESDDRLKLSHVKLVCSRCMMEARRGRVSRSTAEGYIASHRDTHDNFDSRLLSSPTEQFEHSR